MALAIWRANVISFTITLVLLPSKCIFWCWVEDLGDVVTLEPLEVAVNNAHTANVLRVH